MARGATTLLNVSESFNPDIDGILWGWRWNTTNLTYSFPTGTAEYAGYTQISGFNAFTTSQQTAIRSILADVASFCDLTFTETTGGGANLRYAEASSVNYTGDSNVAGNTGLHPLPAATLGVNPGPSWHVIGPNNGLAVS